MSDTVPKLVETARLVVDQHTARAIDPKTGECIEDCDCSLEDAVLLDAQSAYMVVDSYERLEDKSKFDSAMLKVGATKLIHRLWDIYSAKKSDGK